MTELPMNIPPHQIREAIACMANGVCDSLDLIPDDDRSETEERLYEAVAVVNRMVATLAGCYFDEKDEIWKCRLLLHWEQACQS